MNIGLSLLVGAAAGFAYFGGLWLGLRRLSGRARRLRWLPVSGLIRLMLLGVLLQTLAQQGAGVLLAGFGGLWLARGYCLYRLGAAPESR